MNNDIKRRLFLTGIVGTLVGMPIAARLLTGGKRDSVEFQFAKLLKKFRALAETPVSAWSGPPSFQMPLAPPIGGERNYVFFSPAFLPDELSHTLGNEPDTFFAREGVLFFDQTSRGQVVITGGDTFSGVISPYGVEERERQSVSLLLKENELRPAKSQNAEYKNSDIQIPNLLTLKFPKDGQDLRVGTGWKGSTGRVKPFGGVPTDYEIAGFAEIAGRHTVNVAFSGGIDNLFKLPGVNAAKPDKGAVSALRYRGNGYFDLETGLLVRQESDLESLNSGLREFKARDGSNVMTVKSKFIVQLYNV